MIALSPSSSRVGLALVILFVGARIALPQPIVEHPSELVFPELSFDPPDPAQFRVELDNGMVVYLSEDDSLPTFELRATWLGGRFCDPPGKEGLSAMTHALMREGGTEEMTGDELDARLGFLSAPISVWRSSNLYTFMRSERTGGASCRCLAKHIDEVLTLLADVIIRPVFAEDKIRLEREKRLELLRHRYDWQGDLLNTREAQLLFGETLPGRLATGTSVNSITRDDLVDFHRRFVGPNHMILSVSGSFERQAVLDALQALFADLPPVDVEPIPRDMRLQLPGAAAPGVYILNKPGREAGTRVVHLGIERHDPDYIPLQVMNNILGGDWLSSRIPKRVRTAEGLARVVESYVRAPVGYVGALASGFGSAAENVPFAVSLIREEYKRICNEPVSDEELGLAKERMLRAFPGWFDTPFQVVSNFAGLERDGLPMDYYQTYRDLVAAVTKEDVHRVAREHIKPERFLTVVVGDAKKIQAGNPDHAPQIGDFGDVHVIQPGDPLEAD